MLDSSNLYMGQKPSSIIWAERSERQRAKGLDYQEGEKVERYWQYGLAIRLAPMKGRVRTVSGSETLPMGD